MQVGKYIRNILHGNRVAKNTLGVQLEVTTRCNAHCLFCPRDKTVELQRRPVKNIDWPILVMIVKRLKQTKYPFDWISISGLGEPLIYPRITEAIQLIKKDFSHTLLRMNTNASLLKGEVAEGLIESGLDRLICSLNIVDKDEYRRNKRISSSEVTGNIISFLRDKGDRKPDVFIRVNAFDINLPHIKTAKGFWAQYLNSNDRFSMGRFSNWAGKIDRSKFVKHRLKTKRHLCKFLDNERALAINVDGELYPCCVAIAENKESALYLGNLKDNTIKELYESGNMLELVLRHSHGDYPIPCDACDSWGIQVENLKEFRK